MKEAMKVLDSWMDDDPYWYESAHAVPPSKTLLLSYFTSDDAPDPVRVELTYDEVRIVLAMRVLKGKE